MITCDLRPILNELGGQCLANPGSSPNDQDLFVSERHSVDVSVRRTENNFEFNLLTSYSRNSSYICLVLRFLILKQQVWLLSMSCCYAETKPKVTTWSNAEGSRSAIDRL